MRIICSTHRAAASHRIASRATSHIVWRLCERLSRIRAVCVFGCMYVLLCFFGRGECTTSKETPPPPLGDKRTAVHMLCIIHTCTIYYDVHIFVHVHVFVCLCVCVRVSCFRIGTHRFGLCVHCLLYRAHNLE